MANALASDVRRSRLNFCGGCFVNQKLIAISKQRTLGGIYGAKRLGDKMSSPRTPEHVGRETSTGSRDCIALAGYKCTCSGTKRTCRIPCITRNVYSKTYTFKI